MQRIIYLSILFALSITCATAQSKDVRQLDYFNSIQSAGSWDVYIKKGSQEKVVIQADSGPIDKIITEVSGNKLTIEMENGSWSLGNYLSSDNKFKNVKIYVTFTDLGEIVGSGSGSIRLESAINSQDIRIKSSGSGNFYAEASLVASDDISIVNSGSSDIKIMAAVIAGNESGITNSGSGNISINNLKADELEITNSGSGGIAIDGGNINSQSIRLSGSGNMKMEDLNSQNCSIRKSGSGNVYVSVAEKLSGSSSGSGNVYVKNGRPRIDFNFSGSGKIKYQ